MFSIFAKLNRLDTARKATALKRILIFLLIKTVYI